MRSLEAALVMFLFLLGFARVMNRISCALESQGLVKSVPLSEEACAILPAGFEDRFPGFRVPLCSSQYMDDVVFPVIGEAKKINRMVSATAAVVYGEFHKHLLRMNMKQGKSEALIVFGGRGCKEAENMLFRDNGGIIPFEYRGVQHSLFATRVYKHVGTQSCVSGSLAPELKARVASMHGVSTSLGRYFFRRPQIPVPTKLLAARALLLSKGLFSAGTWPTLNASEHRKLHQAIMKVFGGCIVSGWHSKMYSFSVAHQEHHLAAPIHLARQLRLGLFRRVCERAPEDLLPLLVSGSKAKRSWFSAVVDDLRLFARHFQPMAHFLEASVPEIIAFVRAAPRNFSKNVANALKDVGFNHPSVWSCPAVDEILSAWSCGDCDEVFLSARALSAHRFMKHGVKLTCRDKLTETHCPVCLNEFHTRARLVVHVRRASPICCSVLEEHYSPEPPELVAQAEEVSRQQDREFRKMGRHRTWAEFPSFRREGRQGSVMGLNAVASAGAKPVSFLWQGSKDYSRLRLQSIWCDACHRNAPRWVVKRCMSGKVTRRDSEYWVCWCRHWQWIPCKAAVTSAKLPSHKPGIKNSNGVDSKPSRGPLLSECVYKVLGKSSVGPSVEPGGVSVGCCYFQCRGS